MNARAIARGRIAKRVAERVYWRDRRRVERALFIPVRFMGSPEAMGRRIELDGTIWRYEHVRVVCIPYHSGYTKPHGIHPL